MYIYTYMYISKNQHLCSSTCRQLNFTNNSERAIFMNQPVLLRSAFMRLEAWRQTGCTKVFSIWTEKFFYARNEIEQVEKIIINYILGPCNDFETPAPPLCMYTYNSGCLCEPSMHGKEGLSLSLSFSLSLSNMNLEIWGGRGEGQALQGSVQHLKRGIIYWFVGYDHYWFPKIMLKVRKIFKQLFRKCQAKKTF